MLYIEKTFMHNENIVALSQRVVLLIKRLENNGQEVYVDKFHSSGNLFTKLQKKWRSRK